MLLPILFPAACALWWNFTNEGFEEKKTNSFNIPLFAVLYSHWCPHCAGIPGGTLEYAQGDGNRPDLYITLLDCYEQPTECDHFHTSGTPQMILVIGDNRKYWPRTRAYPGERWTTFLNQYLHSSLREIHTDAELFEAKREPYDGGTAFHLETPTNDSDLIRELHSLSRRYRIYNDTYTYRVDPTLREAVLTAHTSPYCSVTWQGGTLHGFLEAHRFGSRHRYDLAEYREVSRAWRTALVVVEERIAPGQQYALEKIPTNHCMRVVFGYISLKHDSDYLNEITRHRKFANADNCVSRAKSMHSVPFRKGRRGR
jgi:hypothetical protein